MPEGSTIIFILCGAGVLGLAGYWVAQDVAHRWQVRHHERMTAWQRRVLHQQEPKIGKGLSSTMQKTDGGVASYGHTINATTSAAPVGILSSQ